MIFIIIFIDKIWLPFLEFKTTPNLAMTLRDNFLLVEVTYGNERLEDDLTEIHEAQIHKGSRNELKATRIYNQMFECEYDVQYFPFDKQVCKMIFALVHQQALVAMLESSFYGALNISSDIQEVISKSRLKNFFNHIINTLVKLIRLKNFTSIKSF